MMPNPMQAAIISKDIKSVVSNKQLFYTLLILPFVMVILVPSIFNLTLGLTSEGIEDFLPLVEAVYGQPDDMTLAVMGLILNYIMPTFFTMVPIMCASVMAASSFVGEKEKRTLETLLYGPLTVRQIFLAKVLAAFLLSMLVSVTSFVAMLAVIELEAWLLAGSLLVPSLNWAAMMLVVSPASSLLAITLIVSGSAKAQTMEESQQRSAFLVIPVLLLVVGQFSGLMLVSGWLLLGIGVAVAALALLLLRRAMGRYTYEVLLD